MKRDMVPDKVRLVYPDAFILSRPYLRPPGRHFYVVDATTFPQPRWRRGTECLAHGTTAYAAWYSLWRGIKRVAV